MCKHTQSGQIYQKDNQMFSHVAGRSTQKTNWRENLGHISHLSYGKEKNHSQRKEKIKSSLRIEINKKITKLHRPDYTTASEV